MVTESMGPIYDRTQEQLGSTDRAISRMRHILISAAKGLAEGKEPPAVAAGLDYASIRGAEKILEPGEDWRGLGTDEDPVVARPSGSTDALRLRHAPESLAWSEDGQPPQYGQPSGVSGPQQPSG